MRCAEGLNENLCSLLMGVGGGDLNAFTGVTTRTKHFWVIAKHPVFLLHAQRTAMLHVCALNKHKCVLRSVIVCLCRAAAVD